MKRLMRARERVLSFRAKDFLLLEGLMDCSEALALFDEECE